MAEMTQCHLLAQLNPGQLFQAVMVVVVLIAFGVIWIVFASLSRYWLQARLSGVQISMFRLLGMRFRRVAVSTIVKAGIMAAHAGVQVSWNELEFAYLQGADLEKVVTAFIEASKQKMDLTFDEIVQAERNERLQALLKL